jgi:ubiquinone/menaquinone biosynthesis C-methylase UbiE
MHSWEDFDHSRAKGMRDRFIPIDRVLEFVKVGRDDTILDIGAGDGEYAQEFAKIAIRGSATAMEFTQAGLKLIRDRIYSSKLKNLHAVEANACAVNDFSGYTKIFMSNVFHDIRCKDDILFRFEETLDAGAEIILIEFKPEAEFGPPMLSRIPERQLETIMARHGFALLDRAEFQFHYMHKYAKKQKQ